MTARSASIDWQALSESAQETLQEIELWIWAGYLPAEVAEMLNCSTAWIRKRRAELRREIEEQVAGGDE